MSPSPESACRGAAAGAIVLAAVLAAPSAFQSPDRQEQPPPTFRTGTNVVRVDATVIDRDGNPVPSLTATDFEVREDGRLQQISSFKFISADGQPSDDRSLPIRSQQHAAAEAARDDVRTFLIFWDEYHIEQFTNALRGREALTAAVLSQFGATDLVGLMDPLTPTSAIELTRDRRALADQVHRLQGRRGVYYPPRSLVEEEHLRQVRQPQEVEIYRSQVTITAIKSAAAYLGTLREGRKTLIVVTEGLTPSRPRRPPMSGPMDGRGAMPPMDVSRFADEQSTALDIVRVANDSNTAIHVVDPRGLQVGAPYAGMLETLAYGSGGELHLTNDIPIAFQRIVKQASATYLLGYTRDLPMDGRFHEIKVRVKRGGLNVRSRAGYWAPRAEDIERAKTSAATAATSEPIARAIAALPPPSAARPADVWVGVSASGSRAGRAQITVAWTPRAAASGAPIPGSVAVVVKTSGGESIEKTIDQAGTTFDVPAGTTHVAMKVSDNSGEVIDRESRTVEAADATGAPLVLGTPIVYRARNPTEVRGILEGERPAIHAGREFARTDRLVIRVPLAGQASAAATLSARLIDRRGARLVDLALQRASQGNSYQLDIPLASIAGGEFVVAIEAVAGEQRAEALVPIRVLR